jgi:NAD-dependent SIR2 family protein deacetylase
VSLYLPVRAKGSAAIAVCYRCSKKTYMDDLKKDPNNNQWFCPECVDIYDPWRLPARQAENISLDHPRPDVDIGVEP